MTPDDFEQRLTILHQQLTDLQDLCRTLSRRVRFLEEPPAKYMSISGPKSGPVPNGLPDIMKKPS